MTMRVASRFDKARDNACPVCRRIFIDFMDLGDGRFGCYDCGAVFVCKEVREAARAGKKAQLEMQSVEVLFKCEECGKVCGSKLGLSAHMRVHR